MNAARPAIATERDVSKTPQKVTTNINENETKLLPEIRSTETTEWL